MNNIANAPGMSNGGVPETWTAEPPGRPMDNAKKILDILFRYDDRWTLLYHRGSFYLWENTHWVELDAEGLESCISKLLDAAVYHTGAGSPPEKFNPTNAKLREIMGRLRDLTYVSAWLNPPAWVDRDGRADKNGGPSVGELLPCRNGLLYAPTRELLPHTPRFLNHHVLQLDYDRNAPTPEWWLKCLTDWFPGDQERADALQEIFGYLLTADTRQQKIFLFKGPTRSGKGTTYRLLAKLVGKHNVGASSLGSLNEHFGLEHIADKSVVVLGDVRFTRQDADLATERLLSITGEDDVPVHVKKQRSYTATLPCRLIMLLNELPILRDNAAALRARMFVVNFTESFLGREDLGLDDKLADELPGILNWALDGLDRLRSRSEFVQPRSGLGDLERMTELTSPVTTFVHECCLVDPSLEVATGELFTAWETWCGKQHLKPGSNAWFARLLYDAYPKLGKNRTSGVRGQNRQWTTTGIALDPERRADYTFGWPS